MDPEDRDTDKKSLVVKSVEGVDSIIVNLDFVKTISPVIGGTEGAGACITFAQHGDQLFVFDQYEDLRARLRLLELPMP
jgi:hypothetical protein